VEAIRCLHALGSMRATLLSFDCAAELYAGLHGAAALPLYDEALREQRAS
jgi:hypothetical protein